MSRGRGRLPFDLGRLRRMNVTLLLCMVALMVVGVCFVFSANSIRDSLHLQSLYRAHAQMAAVGIVAVLALAYTDYRRFAKVAWIGYLAALALLVAVLAMGETRMGARRWVFGMQPSELAKVTTLLALAHLLGRPDARRDIWEFLLGGALTALPMALVLAQPDLGTALIFVPVLVVMLFVAGTAPRAWCTAAAAPAGRRPGGRRDRAAGISRCRARVATGRRAGDFLPRRLPAEPAGRCALSRP